MSYREASYDFMSWHALGVGMINKCVVFFGNVCVLWMCLEEGHHRSVVFAVATLSHSLALPTWFNYCSSWYGVAPALVAEYLSFFLIICFLFHRRWQGDGLGGLR